MLHFYESIRNKTPLSSSVASFKEGYQIMLINDAIVKSVTTGGWVKVEHV
jgi:predicted dehydrogenase